jgi:hypothetical protein
MTVQPKPLNKVQSILFSFTTTELNVLRLIASHWQKMFVCHEIDKGGIAGETFMSIWSPEYTLMKLRDKPSFNSSSVDKGRYSFEGFFEQSAHPLCCFELDMMMRMVNAAVKGELDKFLLLEKGTMRDVIGPHFTQSWTVNSAAHALANKMVILERVAGMFEGHSDYQIVMRDIAQSFRALDGVEAVEHD